MIIGLGGRIKSGKSTVAKILSEQYNLPIVAFAKKLKDLVTACSGLDDSYKGKKGPYNGNVDFSIINDELKKYGYSVLDQNEIDHIRAIEYHDVGDVYRYLLKYLGTEVFRSRNTNHWIDLFVNETTKGMDNGFICDDVRFPNEHHAIKTRFNRRNNGYFNVTMKIVSPDAENNHNHDSEVLIDKIQFDKVFKNKHEGLDKLKDRLNNVFSEIITK
jgi:hypothetical protein